MIIATDIITLVVCGLLLLMGVASPWFSSLARRPRKCEESDSEQQPSLSVVITVHDNAREIERHLPSMLQQQYDGKWEVIIVDESSTDDTQDVLIRMKATYPQLYTTFIPESSHYVSRKKLALTVGIKASHNDWIVMTEIDCRAQNSRWLQTLAAYADNKRDLIMGYTAYDDETPAYWHYDRLQTLCYQMRRMKNGIAYRNVGANLMFRKSAFLRQNGFLQNLTYLRGEYDFIVNEMARHDNMVFVANEEAHLLQECPTHKAWTFAHLYYLESRRHMARTLRQRLLFNTDQWLLHLSWLLPLLALPIAIIRGNATLAVAAAASWLLMLIVRLVIAHQACQQLGESISMWKMPWLELRTIWQNLYHLWRHKRADRYEFIRK